MDILWLLKLGEDENAFLMYICTISYAFDLHSVVFPLQLFVFPMFSLILCVSLTPEIATSKAVLFLMIAFGVIPTVSFKLVYLFFFLLLIILKIILHNYHKFSQIYQTYMFSVETSAFSERF